MDILKLGNCGILTLWDLLAMKVLLQLHVTGAFSSDLNHTFYWYHVLYVYDLLGACECKKFLDKFWRKLSTVFKIRDMGTPSNFLGMEVSHDTANSCISLSQTKYIHELASKFHLPVELCPTKVRLLFTARKVNQHTNHH